MKNSRELEAAMTKVSAEVNAFRRQYEEGLISFHEWRNATVNALVNPAVEAIIKLDDKLIDIRTKADEARLAAFGITDDAEA